MCEETEVGASTVHSGKWNIQILLKLSATGGRASLMKPERVRSYRVLQVRSRIWSYGVPLTFMLSTQFCSPLSWTLQTINYLRSLPFTFQLDLANRRAEIGKEVKTKVFPLPCFTELSLVLTCLSTVTVLEHTIPQTQWNNS